VETEEQRIEREKKEINDQIEELRKTIKQFEAKVKLC
jgi:peptidoglycan hydrolase CwlO-like protein